MPKRHAQVILKKTTVILDVKMTCSSDINEQLILV
jgi:hypothetical protein